MKYIYHLDEGNDLFSSLVKDGYNFFTGLPCSYLKTFLDALTYSNFPHVKIVNESQAVGVAFGAWLANKKPVVYLQESGIGHILNPMATLLIPAGCYDIMFIVTRRYEPYQHTILAKGAYKIFDSINWPLDKVIWVEK